MSGPGSILARIKRAVIAGNVVFTDKARTERVRDGLTEQDVIESVLNALRIDKTIKSTSPNRGIRREYLYILHSPTLTGLWIYTKGKLVEECGIETYYLLISAKLAE
jgi:hypothetical protein